MNRQLFSLVAMLAIAGCGSSSSMTTGTGGNGAASVEAPAAAAPAVPAAAAVAAHRAAPAATARRCSRGHAKIGTYIALGDSISDQGGTGPYFYDLLSADLTAKFPGLTFVHDAQQGAITDVFSDNMPSGVPLLKTQIDGLGNSYPGDVLVTITIGGNDLNAHALAAISNTDAGFRSEFGTHLAAELGELTTPGRLGSGKVYVVLANIYDFTDGQGDFATVMCGPGVNISADGGADLVRRAGTASSADNIAKVGGALYDMHADFMGHGYNNTDTADVWYDSASCIHPNAAGHDAIRRSIYTVLTGEPLP